jgi:hypothetical protein
MTGNICLRGKLLRRQKENSPHNRHQMHNPNNRQSLRPFPCFAPAR